MKLHYYPETDSLDAPRSLDHRNGGAAAARDEGRLSAVAAWPSTVIASIAKQSSRRALDCFASGSQ